MAQKIAWLEKAARKELAGARVPAHDGTILFMPDGLGFYGALWTRDFAYLVRNVFALLQPDEAHRAVTYLLREQRNDGCVPDRVQLDGIAVYSAGHPDTPLGDPPTDNSSFMVSLVYAYAQQAGDLGFARKNLEPLRRALDFTPRSPAGMVHIPPGQRQSPYGFTDTVAKTGELLFSSLLYWAACQEMAELCEQCGENAALYRRRAAAIELGAERLWDDEVGAYRAATEACNQIDIWGSAFAVYIDFVHGQRRQRLLRFLRDRYQDYVWRGQVRHLLRGEYWERLLKTKYPIERDTYQDGAYWATASGWVIYSLAQIDADLARRMLADLLHDFQEVGIYECINVGYRKAEHYLPSVVNPLGALRRIPWLDNE